MGMVRVREQLMGLKNNCKEVVDKINSPNNDKQNNQLIIIPKQTRDEVTLFGIEENLDKILGKIDDFSSFESDFVTNYSQLSEGMNSISGKLSEMGERIAGVGEQNDQAEQKILEGNIRLSEEFHDLSEQMDTVSKLIQEIELKNVQQYDAFKNKMSNEVDAFRNDITNEFSLLKNELSTELKAEIIKKIEDESLNQNKRIYQMLEERNNSEHESLAENVERLLTFEKNGTYEINAKVEFQRNLLFGLAALTIIQIFIGIVM